MKSGPGLHARQSSFSWQPGVDNGGRFWYVLDSIVEEDDGTSSGPDQHVL